MQPLRRGANDDAVAEVRQVLAGLGLLANQDSAAQAVYDESTELAVRHFQQRRGLSIDGIVGRETWSALAGARWSLGDRVLMHNATSMLTGDDVVALQEQLLEMGYDVSRPDGMFGRDTDAGLRAFQRDYGLTPDGVCGPVTLRALRQLTRRVIGGRPQLLREQMRVAESGPSLLGKRLVLDPGHGGDDRGVEASGVCEADIAWDLAARLEGRLTALGVTTWLTRGPSNGKSDEERADFANNVQADVLVSLHVDGGSSPLASGVAAFHYGAGETSSTIGERLADLAQREIVARTGMLDCRAHPKSWALLRLTRMPAVHLELGYLTCAADRARLVDPAFRDTVAEGLLVAVQRLYLPTAEDPPTGVLRMPAIAS